jgi:catechol-2,3-dioxygenase
VQRPSCEPPIIESPLAHAHHAFVVDPEVFLAAPRALEEAGSRVHGPVDWGDHECIYFLDPDGNLLEIVTPSGVKPSAEARTPGS